MTHHPMGIFMTEKDLIHIGWRLKRKMFVVTIDGYLIFILRILFFKICFV